MVKPSYDLIRTYPAVAEWMPMGINAVKSDTRVFDAYVRFSGLTPGFAAKCLSPGSLPEVRRYPNGVWPDDDKKEFGWTSPFILEAIHVSEHVLRKAERKLQRNGGKSATGTLERTILHEMVHWAHVRYGAPDWLAKKGKRFEAGWAFEKWAYGIPGI
ncbi:hypothetical protein [Vannielia litorea]|uniref:hypothetical protein n=1 Tax=Vannielia litorea TaxID=1217970 RepID=UPI001BCDADD3|nr:hypothetical protein [Vannielia litorea]MBS8225968.1 hypothetical protein [Vannielia litorea]